MLSKQARTWMTQLARNAFRPAIGHIKNMNEENMRVKAVAMNEEPDVVKTDRVYKPSQTIEFNRQGEVLLYSGDPLKHETIYFKYPYIFYQSFFPIAIINYLLNPLDLVWYWNSFFVYASPFLFHPRTIYWRDFMYWPQKIYLLRGGRVCKVESNTLGNWRHTYWIETRFCKPLTHDRLHFDDRDEAEFLNPEGQLKYRLSVELEEFKVWGVNTNNEQLHFGAHGTVHEPELFEAAMKGYNIDTTDFSINTADNIRYREAHYNQ